MSTGLKIALGILAAIVLFIVVLGGAVAGTYNSLAQLEGTENRISVERMRFNEASQAFNTRRNSFPTVIVASLFGERFQTKPYFQAQAGAEKAPEVKF